MGKQQCITRVTRHHLMLSMVYVTTLMYVSTNDQWVSSSKTKLGQFSSVQLRRSARAFRLHSRHW